MISYKSVHYYNICCFDGIVAVNCFQDKLPAVICEADTIEVLSLNGLGAAEGCKNAIKFPFTEASLFNTIGGTLPDCVWRLRNLMVLHLTGNGFAGEIISTLPDDSRITDLSLSHNQLSGTLPLHIQAVERVDCSYNQFSGKYNDNSELWINNFLDLRINRLSGRLPVCKLENVSDLNILRGNIFSCDSIPENDEYVNDYICGSEDLNESLYVFGPALTVICCLFFVACLAVVAARKSVTLKGILLPACIHGHCTRFNVYMRCVDQLNPADTRIQPIIILRDECKRVIWLFAQLLVSC